ncbi:arsenite efflux transporter metallochaperone ArsD [Pseudalkalibacillus decolorationis]|uniref:arsenite efflux transporter metallochaperone ArsD n=1 Tax=Pseudalkalibacillus decolorationis TaxID=163879 RepID=UPI0021489266|nr:arsenite efflux transporter metallochaperone ArsD [Pseudalkalibacillus decolorationis]
MKIDIFDPAMCCATGVCGPSVDPVLTRVANTIFLLEKRGIDIHRYNLTNDTEAFISNTTIQKLLDEKGSDALPATIVDGELVKEGTYPTNEEFARWSNVNEKDLIVETPSSKTTGIDLNSLKK